MANIEQMLLFAHAHSCRPDILAPVPDEDVALDHAYAIQRSLHSRSQLPVMVWKLALTAPAPREAHGALEPVVGRLPASAIYTSRSEIRFAGTEMYAEAELVFELAEDLPPAAAPYTRDSVCRALKGTYAGIEIASTRFRHSELPLGLLVADNAMGHGLVLGDRLAPGWEDHFADWPVSLSRNAENPVQGSTARVMGNPLDALVWLANWLCEKGEGGLRREQLVATGSCTGITQIFPNDIVTASFGTDEAVRVAISA